MSHPQLVIVGGGPAGMAAALIAGRARLSTIVVNAESPRNAVAHASHGFFTRDGAHASELLEIGKAQLQKYPTVRYLKASVDAVGKEGDSWIVHAGSEALRAPRVILAIGYRTSFDELDLPGIEAVYGRSVFPCPFCDGFEHADQKLGVFASAAATHLAPLVRMWSEDVVVFTNGRDLDAADRELLDSRSIPVETDKIAQLRHEEGQLRAVRLSSGREVVREAAFLGELHAEPTSDIPEKLGIDRAPHPFMRVEHFVADDFGKTNVEGLYIVGDLKRIFGGISAAAHDGYNCAAGIVHELASH